MIFFSNLSVRIFETWYFCDKLLLECAHIFLHIFTLRIRMYLQYNIASFACRWFLMRLYSSFENTQQWLFENVLKF